MRKAPRPTDLAYYEGLIHKTAYMLVASGVELEQEDIEQILWVKAWKALEAFNPQKSRGLPLDRYVFMCVKDQAKDVAARKRRGNLSLDTLCGAHEDTSGQRFRTAREHFEGKYLADDDRVEQGRAEDEGVRLPNTLTQLEREIVLLLYRDYRQTEAAVELGLSKRDVERSMRSIRAKLADWKPDAQKDAAGVQLSLVIDFTEAPTGVAPLMSTASGASRAA